MLKIGILLLAVPLAFVAGCSILAPEPVRPSKDIEAIVLGSRLFAEASERVRNDYIREVDESLLIAAAMQEIGRRYPDPGAVQDKELVKTAIHGMMESLDANSRYLDAEYLKASRELGRGLLGSVGVGVKKRENHFNIVSLDSRMPAAMAGLKLGDHLVGVDQTPLDGLLSRDVWRMLVGKPGSTVVLTVERGNAKPFEMALTRMVVLRSPFSRKIIGAVGYVRIPEFSEGVTSQLKAAIDSFYMRIGANLKGFVLDLRGNPGGFYGESVTVSNALLNYGRVVTTRGRKFEHHRDAAPFDKLDGLPVVVLIDSTSAGAAEIVAGALKDNGRAVLVGEKTVGKGTAETIFPLSDGSMISLITGRYVRPSGRQISDGIEPDYVVVDVKDVEDKDEPLAFALKLLNEGKVRAARP